LLADPEAPETMRAILGKRLQSQRRLGANVYDADPNKWYERELALFHELNADPVDHLTKYVRHLRTFKRRDGSYYSMLIVIDNIDLGSDEYQRCIYGLARQLASDTPEVVVLW
jgi:hypothetical protein